VLDHEDHREDNGDCTKKFVKASCVRQWGGKREGGRREEGKGGREEGVEKGRRRRIKQATCWITRTTEKRRLYKKICQYFLCSTVGW
jgi:hypothetical protein